MQGYESPPTPPRSNPYHGSGGFSSFNKPIARDMDGLSDVPSDELNDMLQNGVEQDLSGFSQRSLMSAPSAKASAIQRGLAAFSPSDPRLTPPMRNHSSSTSEEIRYRHSKNGVPCSPISSSSYTSNTSWDEEDRQVQRERRRIKRATRKHREHRKQPPVTMEV